MTTTFCSFTQAPSMLCTVPAAVDELLADEDKAQAMAATGREHVRENFLADSHFVNWIAVLRDLT